VKDSTWQLWADETQPYIEIEMEKRTASTLHGVGMWRGLFENDGGKLHGVTYFNRRDNLQSWNEYMEREEDRGNWPGAGAAEAGGESEDGSHTGSRRYSENETLRYTWCDEESALTITVELPEGADSAKQCSVEVSTYALSVSARYGTRQWQLAGRLAGEAADSTWTVSGGDLCIEIEKAKQGKWHQPFEGSTHDQADVQSGAQADAQKEIKRLAMEQGYRKLVAYAREQGVEPRLIHARLQHLSPTDNPSAEVASLSCDDHAIRSVFETYFGTGVQKEPMTAASAPASYSQSYADATATDDKKSRGTLWGPTLQAIPLRRSVVPAPQ
jgi:hypothetical protein